MSRLSRSLSRIFRIFLAALLIAGLPARGYASVLMQAGFGARGVAAVPAPQGAGAHHHDHEGAHHEGASHHAGVAHHGSAAHHGDTAPAVAAHHEVSSQGDAARAAGVAFSSHSSSHSSPHSSSHSSAPAASSCGACGDCCSVGVLQTVATMLSGEAPVTRVAALSHPLPASFVADLPVPPPNPLAA
jgi:hypothetical protein